MQFHLIFVCIEVVYRVFCSVERLDLRHSKLFQKREVQHPGYEWGFGLLYQSVHGDWSSALYCFLHVADFLLDVLVATPEPGSTRLASPNRNPGDARLILFIYILLRFLFQKCSDLNPWPDSNGRPNRSPVYSDVFIYLIKTFYYFISLRKRFQFWEAHNHSQIQCNSVGP